MQAALDQAERVVEPRLGDIASRSTKGRVRRVMMADERRIVREEGRYWWVLLVSGIAWLLIAWIVLRLDVTSVATVGVLIGAVFIVAAVNEVTVAGLVPGGWKVWHYVMAFIFFLGGLWGLITPIETFFALASVLGLILVFYGVFEIARAVSTRATNPYWWVGLITGVLLLLLAFWVSGSDRAYALAQRAYLILFWVGLFALFKGIMQIMLAFGVRRAGKEIDAASAMA
jgi:uncharacterized membrane protein HdeD (DUF308 family)